jgi:hypothetical protein
LYIFIDSTLFDTQKSCDKKNPLCTVHRRRYEFQASGVAAAHDERGFDGTASAGAELDHVARDHRRGGAFREHRQPHRGTAGFEFGRAPTAILTPATGVQTGRVYAGVAEVRNCSKTSFSVSHAAGPGIPVAAGKNIACGIAGIVHMF